MNFFFLIKLVRKEGIDVKSPLREARKVTSTFKSIPSRSLAKKSCALFHNMISNTLGLHSLIIAFETKRKIYQDLLCRFIFLQTNPFICYESQAEKAYHVTLFTGVYG